MSSRPFPIVITAPSGTGKTTVCRRLLALDPRLRYAPSTTTRTPRPGEVDGADYVFVSREEFARRRAAGDFLEDVELFGAAYGSPRAAVRDGLAAGYDVLLALDLRGSAALRQIFPECVTIFLAPPSLDELAARLSRRDPTPGRRDERLARAPVELAAANGFDYVVVNDDLERAVADLAAIVRAERLRANRQGGP